MLGIQGFEDAATCDFRGLVLVSAGLGIGLMSLRVARFMVTATAYSKGL